MNRWYVSLLLALWAVTPAAAQSNPVVIVDTNHGLIKLELFADKAPVTVNNFLQYVDERFYDNTLFHRVHREFYIQGGGHEPGMKLKKTRAPVKSEADNGLRNVRGAVGLTRTATSQFYINVSDNTYIDELRPAYTVFGKVIAGMEVVDKIRTVPVTNKDKFDALPTEDVLIRSIRLASHFQLLLTNRAAYPVNQVFSITAHVEHPIRGQSLTLELPSVLELVEGKEIQPIALFPDVSFSLVTWRVRGLRPGEYEYTVRSSAGQVQTQKIKVAAAVN